jgi:hypothetical protein
MLVLDLFQRDSVRLFRQSGISDPKSFAWDSTMRPQYTEPQGSGGRSDAAWSVCDVSLQCEYSYVGPHATLVVTPTTERACVAIVRAVAQQQSSSIVGPAQSGKSSLLRDVATMMGRVVLPVLCCHDLDAAAVQNLLTGCAGGGLWCVFENFAALSLSVSAVLSEQTTAIFRGLATGSDTLDLGPSRSPLAIRRPFTISIETSLLPGDNRGLGRTVPLPAGLRSKFRPVSVETPDVGAICELVFMREGFQVGLG